MSFRPGVGRGSLNRYCLHMRELFVRKSLSPARSPSLCLQLRHCELRALAGSTGGAVGGPRLHLKGSSTKDPDPRGNLAQTPSTTQSRPFPASPSQDARYLGYCPFSFLEVKSRRNNKPLKPALTGPRIAGLPAKVTQVKKIKSCVSQHIKSETVPRHMPSIRPAPSPQPRNTARLGFRAAVAAFASCLFLVILRGFLELVLKGAGQLIEESHFFAVLQEPSRGRGLICSGGNTEQRSERGQKIP